VTSLFGGASTLYRLISQNNIVSLYTNNQPIPYSDNGVSNIGRVMMSVVMSPDLQATGPGTVGSLMSYVLTSPADAGRAYQMGTSLTTGPIPLGSRRLWLGIDKVLEVSVTGLLPATFRNYSGVLNSTGGGAATLAIPNITQLKGVQFVSAYVTLMPRAPQGISGISGSHVLTVQ
jgi:hypothetical protein